MMIKIHRNRSKEKMKNHQIKAFQPFGNGGINFKFFVELIIELMYLNVDQGTIANF